MSDEPQSKLQQRLQRLHQPRLRAQGSLDAADATPPTPPDRAFDTSLAPFDAPDPRHHHDHSPPADAHDHYLEQLRARWEPMGAQWAPYQGASHALMIARDYPDHTPHGHHRLGQWRGGEALIPHGATIEQVAFLDIETAGLRQDDLIFCVGVGRWHANMFHVKQLLLASEEDERDQLAASLAMLEGCVALCTFNGKSFDVPRLAHRIRAVGLDPGPLRALPHVDLLHVLRKRRDRTSKRANLATLERDLLGLQRLHDIPGKEAPLRWSDYLASGDPAPLDGLLEHNRLDIVSLAALLTVGATPQETPHQAQLLAPPVAPLPVRAAPPGQPPSELASQTRPQARAPAAAPQATHPASVSPQPPPSGIHARLERTYALRQRSGPLGAAPSAGGAPSGASGPADSGQAPVATRTTWLRERVALTLQQGGTLDDAEPWLMELVALSPHHPYGLEQLAKLYRRRGLEACADALTRRLRASSPY